jgi:hypothetical protein
MRQPKSAPMPGTSATTYGDVGGLVDVTLAA